VAEGQVLQVVVFSVLFGIALLKRVMRRHGAVAGSRLRFEEPAAGSTPLTGPARRRSLRVNPLLV
jgi:hypothetical protein